VRGNPESRLDHHVGRVQRDPDGESPAKRLRQMRMAVPAETMAMAMAVAVAMSGAAVIMPMIVRVIMIMVVIMAVCVRHHNDCTAEGARRRSVTLMRPPRRG
jgi:hypothetical protein